jgi:hypothetical protein
MSIPTIKEYALMVKIAKSEFNSVNGNISLVNSPSDTHTWKDQVLTSQSCGGLYSSLLAKGYVTASNNEMIGLTQKGVDFLQQVLLSEQINDELDEEENV